jgi:polyferredoxin/YHS domain-containing protein
MTRLLKVFLPWSMFAGLGLAIWFSNARPVSNRIVIEAASPDSIGEAKNTNAHCAGCGALLDIASAVHRSRDGQVLLFCCNHCRKRHDEGHSTTQTVASPPAPAAGPIHIDPVCHMEVSAAWGIEAQHHGQSYFFCTVDCRDRFIASPAGFLGDRCVVCNKLNDPATTVTATYLGKTWRLCSEEHRHEFKADPSAFFMHTMWGIPTWMYYLSIAGVLVVSFGVLERRGAKPAFAIDSPILSSLVQIQILPKSSKALAADRIDLLASPVARFFATSRVVRFAAQAVIVLLFFLVIAAGLFGNQNPALNIAPILTWTIWWGGLVILIMFAGKAWCWVCPWDAVAGWMEKLRFWKKTDGGLSLNSKWPRPLRNIVIATVLFVGLTWIELGFGVTMRPAITAYLAIAMLLMAIVSAFLFEKKGFCRYACLVGRVSGLYAMFSGIEVRSKDQSVCRSCSGKECVNGSQTAYGCPTFLFPGYLTSNTYCIQCMECVQACPEDNLAVNLRPWGADLISEHRPRTDEAYLALLMLSITGFHGLTMTPNWARLTDWLSRSLSLGNLLAFSLGMTLLMLFPILVYALLVGLSYSLGNTATSDGRHSFHDYFVRYAYALLPIALFYHLAHNMEHLLMEGPKIVALLSDPFGWNWNILGTARWKVPPLVSLDVLWIVQVALVLVGHVYSLWIAHHTSRQLFPNPTSARRSQLPMLVAMIAFSIFSLWLLKQPMEMRTSAM